MLPYAVLCECLSPLSHSVYFLLFIASVKFPSMSLCLTKGKNYNIFFFFWGYDIIFIFHSSHFFLIILINKFKKQQQYKTFYSKELVNFISYVKKSLEIENYHLKESGTLEMVIRKQIE